MLVSRRRVTAVMTIIGVVTFAATGLAQFWPQWALNSRHTGEVAVAGQSLNRILTSVVYDSLAPTEMAANSGELLAHYQVPLVDNDRVFMEFKSGSYNKNRYSSERWGENGFRWQNGRLAIEWSFTSDWTAVGSPADFWEPVFHAVLANGTVCVPGAGGTLFRLDEISGTVLSRINPFGAKIDPSVIVASVPSADAAGNIYYNAIQQFNGGTLLAWSTRTARTETCTRSTRVERSKLRFFWTSHWERRTRRWRSGPTGSFTRRTRGRSSWSASNARARRRP